MFLREINARMNGGVLYCHSTLACEDDAARKTFPYSYTAPGQGSLVS